MTAVTTPRRTRLARSLTVAAGIGAVIVVAGIADNVSAGIDDQMSAGCIAVNDSSLDDVYVFMDVGPDQFAAGETITVSAGRPTPGRTPAVTSLTVDDEVVASGEFPASLQYTMPAGGSHHVAWRVNAFGATWDVSCRPACTIMGTPSGDILVGTAGADVICGLAGGDVVDGRGGNDLIFGGDGGDAIRGGGGQDQLFGEAGGDAINGRDGSPGDVVTGGAGGDSLAGDPGDTLTQ